MGNEELKIPLSNHALTWRVSIVYLKWTLRKDICIVQVNYDTILERDAFWKDDVETKIDFTYKNYNAIQPKC